MKKIFSLLMVAMVLVTTLYFSVGTARADATNAIFDAPGATKDDAKGALMLEGSDWNPVYCVIRDDQAVCRVGEEYAGTEVRILLGGKMYVVDVPAIGTGPAVPTCTGNKVLGANVKFTDTIPNPVFSQTSATFFIAGDTLEIVANRAETIVKNSAWEEYEIVSGLICGREAN